MMRSCYFTFLVLWSAMLFAQLKPGEEAPEFSQQSLTGETVTLEGVEAQLILLDFWAGWCGPCIKTFKIMKPLYEKYDREELEIIGISYDRSESMWRSAVKRNELPWIQVYDKDDGELYRKYGISEVPTYFLISREGEVLETEITSYNLKSVIRKHLKNRQEH